MVDRQYDLKLLLYYYVYEAADVIGRSAKIVNASSQDVQLTRLMSLQLDLMTVIIFYDISRRMGAGDAPL